MNLNIFKGIIPNKSILNKNKWLLLVIVVLVYLGFYWYFKKSQENYYNSGLKLADWGGDYPSAGDVKIEDLSNDNKKLLKLNCQIRDLVGIISKANEKLADNMKCKLTRKGESVDTLEEYKKGIIEYNPGSGRRAVWGFKTNESRPKEDDNGKDIPSCDDVWNSTVLFELNQIEEFIHLQLKSMGIVTQDASSIEYINEIIHEEVILYLGAFSLGKNSNCVPSQDFYNNIWNYNMENLKQVISDTFPGIKYQTETYLDNGGYRVIQKDVVRCEKNPVTGDDNEDLSATPSIEKCKIAGFYRDPPDDTLVFPLIQYSFLGKTNKSGNGDYKLYKDNFDPTIKLDQDGNYNKINGLKEDQTTYKYTSEKIIMWIRNIRHN